MSYTTKFFEISDLLSHVYIFLDLKEIYSITYMSKTCHKASKKYKNMFRFICCMKNCNLPSPSFDKLLYKNYTCSSFDIQKLYYEKIKELCKELKDDLLTGARTSLRDSEQRSCDSPATNLSGDYICLFCRTMCYRCTNYKNKMKLIIEYDQYSFVYGLPVCKFGCEKKCDKCYKRIGRKDTTKMSLDNNFLYYTRRPWIDCMKDETYQMLLVDKTINGVVNEIFCEDCHI